MMKKYVYEMEISEVCEDWCKDFWNFVKDAEPIYKEQYKEGFVMTRNDRTKLFNKDNLIFCDIQHVHQNRSNAVRINIYGVDKTLKEVHEILKEQRSDIPLETMRNRHSHGIPLGLPNNKNGYLWKGEYKSLKEICKEENVRYGAIKTRIHRGESYFYAIEMAKYDYLVWIKYQGKNYRQYDLVQKLAIDWEVEPLDILPHIKKCVPISQIKSILTTTKHENR